MSNWHNKASEELDRDYDDGLLSQKDYQAAMRDLDNEYEESLQDVARDSL